jgi:predicted GTPase
MSLPNVIIFGESGAGKSSCVNMLDGDCDAKVSNKAATPTFTSICYEKTISDLRFRVFDAVGLDETIESEVKPQGVIDALRSLIHQLDGGVNLLVYVMQAPRIKDSAKQNYDMFFDGFCKRKVPIVIVVTGLEEEQKMDAWWETNGEDFNQYGMRFSGFACITATKGKRKGTTYPYEDEYNKSKIQLQQLVYKHCLRVPWVMPPDSWLETVNTYIHSNVRIFSDGSAPTTTPRTTTQSRPIPNVILFGESGVGKSSIINMINEQAKAPVSDSATGETFHNTSYEMTIFDSTVRVFDTSGLNEGTKGTVKAQVAIKRLYELICRLQDGVHLLAFVMRAPRITDTVYQNYELFFEVFFQKKVPIAIILTGLENRENMDEWWKENEAAFDRYGMKFKGHACITSIRGECRNGAYLYQKEYDESKKKVKQLIHGSRSQVGWKMDSKTWFNAIIYKVIGKLDASQGVQRKLLSRALQDYGGMSKQLAKAEAKKFEESLRKGGKI